MTAIVFGVLTNSRTERTAKHTQTGKWSKLSRGYTPSQKFKKKKGKGKGKKDSTQQLRALSVTVRIKENKMFSSYSSY